MNNYPKAVVYLSADVDLFNEYDGEGIIIALTPNARARAAELGFEVLDHDLNFNNSTVQTISESIANQRPHLEHALQCMPMADREVVRTEVDRFAFGLRRIWHSLGGKGPWLFVAGGNWISTEDKNKAYSLACDMVFRPVLEQAISSAKISHVPPLPLLFLTIRRMMLGLARFRHGGPRIIAGSYKNMFGLPDKLMAGGGSVYVVEPAFGNWRDYLSLTKQLLLLFLGNIPIVVKTVQRSAPVLEFKSKVLMAQLPDGHIKETIRNIRDLIDLRLSTGRLVRADFRLITQLIKPSAMCSAELSRSSDWLVSEVCREEGIPSWVITRNAQTPCSERVGVDAKERYFLSRMPKGMVDNIAVWSPWFERAAQQYLGHNITPNLIPFRKPEEASTLNIRPIKNRRRRILVADSFAVWWTRNWAFMQSSDEFIIGLKHLKDAASLLPNTEVLVRVKQKHECTLSDIEKLVGSTPYMRFKERSGSFLEDAANADLVSAFFSTTLLESVEIGRPVLLFGGTSRVKFLPARTKAPTAWNDRSAVYTFPEMRNGFDAHVAAEILDKILHFHAGNTLSAMEKRDFLWSDPAAEIGDLADMVANRHKSAC